MSTGQQGRDVEMIAMLQGSVDRFNFAYGGPYGSWGQRWLPFVCKHESVRCTHGDEIIARKWRRRVCLDCGRALRGPLPRACAFTGKDHFSVSS